jgi:hypothetical protein
MQQTTAKQGNDNMPRTAQKHHKPTYAQLEQQIKTMQSLQISTLKNALRYLTPEKVGPARLMASACIVSITDTSGEAIVQPFGIRDGLSAETLQLLCEDVKRSIALAQL